jgi:hypothetical protein
MNISELCAPALLYLAFSLTHIIVDMFKHMYNTALIKFIVMIIFTYLLNVLCQRGLGVISWLIVFIPFITMTIITTLVLIAFSLHPSKGDYDYRVVSHKQNDNDKHTKNRKHEKIYNNSLLKKDHFKAFKNDDI